MMKSVHLSAQKAFGVVLWATMIIAASTLLPASAHAERVPLMPQAKLRIAVVQWIPSKGEYQRWESVSGEFVVSADGTLTLPLIGAVTVIDSDATELAQQIAERLKAKTGLIDTPDASVEILDYPPVYVLGSVAAPGAKQFRPGLTVLQALSLSGGVFRPATESGLKGQISMHGDLEDTRNDILRSIVRVSRLQAEMAGDKDIKFPADVMAAAGKSHITEVINQERIIFTARRNALDRQLQNLAELRGLLVSEIDVLGQKTQALEANIKLVENELSDVKSLVDRGIATVSRRSELERAVSSLRADRLDQITATMRARQNLSEATRNEVGLRDKYQTEVSTELQQVQASLERLRIKEDVLKKTLVLTSTKSDEETEAEARVEPELSFIIVRKKQGSVEEFAASESTVLLANDVVKVSISDRAKKWTLGSAEATPVNK